MGSIELVGVTVSRGGRRVLDGIDLEVAAGERVVLLGPSGAGKTSVLRAVAGLDPLETGQVLIAGVDVTGLGPEERNVAMVDQAVSLQTHLDVRGNLEFALRLRRYPPQEIEERVEAEARAFSIQGLLRRRPRTLSAGQRHEVGLARSLVRRAEALLLDEPLAAIDAGRRDDLIRQLVDVQVGYGVTMLVATNDQAVSMRLADRLAVLRDGRVIEAGTPIELHTGPATEFTAGFLGSPPMNLHPGMVTRGRAGVEVLAGALRLPSWSPVVSQLAGREVTVGVRPEAITAADGHSRFVLTASAVSRELLGAHVSLTVEDETGTRWVVLLPRSRAEIGHRARLVVDPARVHLFEPGGRALAHGV